MNKENIQKLIDLLESEQGAKRGVGFNMSGFLTGKLVGGPDEANDDKFTKGNPCGTIACIAGHAAILAKPSRSLKRLFKDDSTWVGDDMEDIAQKWLGIGTLAAGNLFYGRGSEASLSEITPAQAINVLKHLRDTGKVDWTINE